MVDLVSILPAYIWLFFTGAHALGVIRVLRFLRIFRILKMSRYISVGNVLVHALRSSWQKISVFLMSVVLVAIIAGAIMYLIEWAQSGFTSIPRSVYRAIVTITTVGYGDISPATPVGQFLASLLMIIWYAVIAVPTGIVSAEMTSEKVKKDNTVEKSK
jgi:voltage-gated potassium channel